MRRQLRVDILNTTPPAVEVHPYIPGTPLNPPSSVILPHPISLVARQKHGYFVAPESFSLLAMFKNPMMMIMLVTAVMAIGTPYLMVRVSRALLGVILSSSNRKIWTQKPWKRCEPVRRRSQVRSLPWLRVISSQGMWFFLPSQS